MVGKPARCSQLLATCQCGLTCNTVSLIVDAPDVTCVTVRPPGSAIQGKKFHSAESSDIQLQLGGPDAELLARHAALQHFLHTSLALVALLLVSFQE